MTVEAQRLAEECKSLLTAATNATFDCGEWSGESAAGNEEPERAYGPLAQAALDAKAAVHAAIDKLASLIPPGGLAEEARDAARYRHMRSSAQFLDRNGPGLYWYLPMFRDGSPAERLDASIDAALSAPTPQQEQPR